MVDQAEFTYEKPIYSIKKVTICSDCGKDITFDHDHINIEISSGHTGKFTIEVEKVQTGTKTIKVEEKGHFEVQVVKNAWTEKVLVREAGWY